MAHAYPIHSRPTRLGYSVCLGALLLMSTAFWQLYPYAVYLGCGLFTCCILAAFFSRHHTQHVHGRWLLPISPHAGQYASIGAELSQQDQHSVPLHLYAWDARQDNLGMVATRPGLGDKE